MAEHSPLHLDKGKARANSPQDSQEPTEASPLLASQSYITHSDDDNLEPANQSNRGSLISTLTTVFLITLSVSILLVLLLLSLAYSYAAKASQLSNNDILDNALAFQGPDAVSVLNVSTQGDMWLSLSGRVGFDAGAVIGVKPSYDDSFFLDIWKSIGRWGIHNLDTVSIALSSITITSQYDPSLQLASIKVPPIQIPLTANPPDDTSWLTPMSLPVHIHPSGNISAWLEFARESWQSGYAVAQATVTRADIQGGTLQRPSWRSVLRMDKPNVTLGLRVKLPVLPGLPLPGNNRSLPSISDLVHLANFSVSSRNHNLVIDAKATFINPAPSFVTFTSPPLPFVIWVPAPLDTTGNTLVPVSAVTADPFTLTHPNITLYLHGKALPIPESAAPALSSLLSDYLSGIDHPIAITSPFEFFANYTARTTFPAPHPRPELLRNVTIEDMKIRPSGTTILTNGVVKARIALPEGMDATLDINRILPDALIFDGALPTGIPQESPLPLSSSTPTKTTARGNSIGADDDNDDGDDVPPAPPLPSPLPPRAFARVRPASWLSAVSVRTAPRRDWNERGNTTLLLSAWFVDVPLEVLPGRERQFRSFVGKVIFHPRDGAVAGVRGVAAVNARIDGLVFDKDQDQDEHERTGEGDEAEEVDAERTHGGLVLEGLPFQGSVRVGSQR